MSVMRIAITGCLLAICAARASADSGQAKALFEEGRKLVEQADKVSDPLAKADKVAAACDKFAASLAQDAQLGTKLNLADCRIRQNKLVEAYAILDDAAAEATRTHDREAFAKTQLQALATKLVRVKVRVADPDTEGMAIILNNRHLAHNEWTKPQIVAPGPIVVEVSAPDHKPARLTDNGTAGAQVIIVVPELDPLPGAGNGSGSGNGNGSGSGSGSADIPTEPKPERSKVPYVVMVGGGVLIATSGGIGLHARSRYVAARNMTPPGSVTAAQHEADIATGIFALGAVALVVGIYLYVNDKPADKDKDKDKPAVTALVSPDSFGLAVIGSF
jgi:hypothetical protein